MAIQTTSVSYSKIRPLPTLLSRYANREPALTTFISDFPDMEAIERQMKRKGETFTAAQRQRLQQVLQEQTGTHGTPMQEKNLRLLTRSTTFSVSCGHQLNLAGGPVYMAYKILTVIKLAEDLNARFPNHDFVPIHWLASEDHDLDEIKSVSFFGQKIDFQVEQTGAVGRMKTADLAQQMAGIKDFPEWMVSAYEGEKTLSEATRQWLQHAFGQKGLLVLDADHPSLKQAFADLALREVDTPWVEKTVQEQTAKLEALHLKSQIYARPINLFYLTNTERLRLEEKDGKIRTVDSGYEWNKTEALRHFAEHPEVLSPNVAFRPLYSQVLLPDVAFIGGPAEVAYWLQLCGVFEQAKIPMPVLLPRFSAVYVNAVQAKKMEKLGLTTEDLLKEDHELKKQASGVETQMALPSLEMVYQDLVALAEKVDPTLGPMAKGELARIEKIMDGILKRISKTAEQKNEQQISQILNLVRKLFPEGGLQERSEGWLSFVVNDKDWLEKVYAEIHPLELDFKILVDR